MSNSSPSFDFLVWNQVRWSLGTLLGAVALSIVGLLDGFWVPVSLLCVVTLLAFLVRPSLASRIPSWIHTLSFPVTLVGFAADLAVLKDPIPAFLRLAVLLTVYRSCSPRKRRDDLQLLILGLFVLIVTGILTISPLYIALLCLFFLLGLALLAVRSRLETLGRDPSLELGEHSCTWREVRRHVFSANARGALAVWSLLALGTLVLAAAFFVAMPRFEASNSLLLEKLLGKKVGTGFTDRVAFGDFNRIREDTTVAFRVDVEPGTALPAALYWRMAVLDTYREGAFFPSAALLASAFEPVAVVNHLDGMRGLPRQPVLNATLYLEPGSGRYLPLTGRFKSLHFSDLQSVRTSPLLQLVSLPNETYSLRAFRIRGMETAPSMPDPSPSTLPARSKSPSFREVELPDAERRRLQTCLAEIFPGGIPSSAEPFASSATAWLQQRHSYSLTLSKPAEAGDHLVSWLLSRDDGHCELFAGALVLLAREAGFPARLVAGYVGGSWTGDYLVVRNSDAHAWCEVRDEKGSWLRIDPTPSSGFSLRGGPAPTTLATSSWSDRLDRLRMLWYRHVVNFDHDSQVALAKQGKSAARTLSEKVTSWLQTAREFLDFKSGLSWQAIAVRTTSVLAALALAVGCGLAGVALLRRAKGGKTSVEAALRRDAGLWLQRLPSEPNLGALRASLERIRYGPTPARDTARRVLAEAKRVNQRRSRSV